MFDFKFLIPFEIKISVIICKSQSLRKMWCHSRTISIKTVITMFWMLNNFYLFYCCVCFSFFFLKIKAIIIITILISINGIRLNWWESLKLILAIICVLHNTESTLNFFEEIIVSCHHFWKHIKVEIWLRLSKIEFKFFT